jgi:hypothetical protein
LSANLRIVHVVADVPTVNVITNDTPNVTVGNAHVQIIHAAPQAPEVNINLTPQNTNLSAEQELAIAHIRISPGKQK